MVPPNHPFVHRVLHHFHHPFWGFSSYFWVDIHLENINFLRRAARGKSGMCKLAPTCKYCQSFENQKETSLRGWWPWPKMATPSQPFFKTSTQYLHRFRHIKWNFQLSSLTFQEKNEETPGAFLSRDRAWSYWLEVTNNPCKGVLTISKRPPKEVFAVNQWTFPSLKPQKRHHQQPCEVCGAFYHSALNVFLNPVLQNDCESEMDKRILCKSPNIPSWKWFFALSLRVK